MIRSIKAHPTKYSGVQFRSRLEARWAAFFDLCQWRWEYEPVDLCGWTPDFRVTFPCGHSECGESHTLLVEVKPYYAIEEFHGHPCMDYPHGRRWVSGVDVKIPADASAAFGVNPHVTYWEMTHGHGGGIECVDNWMPHGNTNGLWKEAGNVIQWIPKRP